MKYNGSIWSNKIKEDTEKATLPPIQHEKTKSDIIEVDLTLNPVHSSDPKNNNRFVGAGNKICWERREVVNFERAEFGSPRKRFVLWFWKLSRL
jgi:hypothetical protein